jgi:GT2 family glycosyltransferase
MKNKNIYVIVVTFNGLRWYDSCFESLKNSETPLQIIVVDNASTDGTVEFLQEKYPEITLFPQTENLGFGKANNIGIKYALENGADYAFLLNQDAWIEQDTMQKLLEVFEQNLEAGIVAPLQLDGSGENLDVNVQRIYLSEHNAKGVINDMYFRRLKPYYEVEKSNAAAWLVSRKCIEKVGGFDTLLFYHYGEDFNYCQRVHYHGFKIYLTPTIIVYHDRADRNGSFTKEFENAWISINSRIHFGNTLMPDSQFNSAMKRSIVKYFLKLKIRQFFKEIKSFRVIGKSREINKNGGMIWF